MQDVHHETTTTTTNNNNKVSIPVTVGTTTILESAVVPSCVVITPVNKNNKTGKRTNTVVTDVDNVGVVAAASASTTTPKATKKPRVEKLPIEDIIGDYNDDLYVIGLSSGTQDRNCFCHKICGEYLQVGDLVRLVMTIVKINGKFEEAIKVVKIESDGLPSCTVGFIPRVQSKIDSQIGKFCIVKEVYSQSSDKSKRDCSSRNRGMASLVYVDSIPASKLPYSKRFLNSIPHDE